MQAVKATLAPELDLENAHLVFTSHHVPTLNNKDKVVPVCAIFLAVAPTYPSTFTKSNQVFAYRMELLPMSQLQSVH